MMDPKQIILFFLFFILLTSALVAQSGGADYCSDSEPLCGSNVFSYPNSSGGSEAEIGPDYGCLGSQPNPAWFFLQIANNGNIILTIEQSTSLGGPPDLDVDFILYGPFIDTDIACVGGLTFNNTVDCSYSPNNVENVTISNAVAGDYYLLLITNYSNLPGYITVNQSSGTGQTNCGILADVVGCSGDIIDLDATTATATNYKWYEDDGSGNYILIPGVNNPIYPVLNSNLYKAEALDSGNNLLQTFNFNVAFFELPLVNPNISDYDVCDDDGFAEFNFNNKDAEILNGLNPNTFEVTYYRNASDANTGSNPILIDYDYTNSLPSEVIYARVDNISTDLIECFDVGSFNINVAIEPKKNVISDFMLCGYSNASFDLSTKDNEVIGTQLQDILVSYHATLSDAENNLNALPSNYSNTTSPQTIYVRSQFDYNGNGIGDSDECYTTEMTFQLIVNAYPIIYQPDTLQKCNDQVNTVYDLTVSENQITGGDTTISLTYFESQLDLDNNNPIATPSNYYSTTFTKDIFVLATNTNICSATTTLALETILYENLNEMPTPIEECEVDNDGFDSFDLTRRENEILRGLNPLDYSFVYYEIETDAIAGNNNSIPDPKIFINTVPINQTIYIRVSPKGSQCFVVIYLELIVNPVPEIGIEERYVICLSPNNEIISPNLISFLPNPPINTGLSPSDFMFQWYQGDPVFGNEIVGETSASYMPSMAGIYSVIATNNITGCTIPATTEVYGSYPPESISVELRTDAFSNNDILEVQVTGNGPYEYSLDHGLWQDSSIFEDVIGGVHTIYVRDLYNCNEISDIQMVIDYPRFFTPNGDSYNNNWNIVGIENQPFAKIFIYDRYGKLLKQINASGAGWDGTFNGDKLPASDYWFTVEYMEPKDGIMRTFKSHFTLKR